MFCVLQQLKYLQPCIIEISLWHNAISIYTMLCRLCYEGFSMLQGPTVNVQGIIATWRSVKLYIIPFYTISQWESSLLNHITTDILSSLWCKSFHASCHSFYHNLRKCCSYFLGCVGAKQLSAAGFRKWKEWVVCQTVRCPQWGLNLTINTDTVSVPLTMTGSLFSREEVIEEKDLPPDVSNVRSNNGYLFFNE